MTRNVIFKIFMIASLSVFTSCATTSLALIDKKGLKYKNNEINIFFKENNIFINSNWLVNNWKSIKYFKKNRWDRKKGKAFHGIIKRDLNEDGNIEFVDEYYSELQLVNKFNDAEITSYVSFLPKSKENTNVGVFLSYYLENLSGSRSLSKISDSSSNLTSSGKIYASKLINSANFKINNKEAVIASIEIANLHQYRLDKNHLSRKIVVFMLKINDFKCLNSFKNRALGMKKEKGEKYLKTPAIFVNILSSNPGDFDKIKNDFYSYLESMKIDGKKIALPKEFVSSNYHQKKSTPAKNDDKKDPVSEKTEGSNPTKKEQTPDSPDAG